MAGLAQGLRGSDFEADIIKGMGLWKMSPFHWSNRIRHAVHSHRQHKDKHAGSYGEQKISHNQDEYSSFVSKKRFVNPIVCSSSNSSLRNGHCTPLPTCILPPLSKVFNYRAQSIWWTGRPWGGCLLTRCAHKYVFPLSKWVSLASKPMPPPLVRELLNK